MDETEADGAGVGGSSRGGSGSAPSGGESGRGESGGGEPSRGESGGGGSGGDVFDQLAAARERRLQAQADELSLIVAACLQHRVNETTANRGVERLVAGGADGTPLVGEFLAHELALVLHITP
ncbi:MAG: hypothetical protein IPL43_06890 [Micropruina sp.]|nr:hypothetical protein [Micropruina sp.]